MSRVSPVKCDGRDQPQTYCRKSDINQIIPYLTTLENPERSEHIWYANGLQLMRYSRHQRTPWCTAAARVGSVPPRSSFFLARAKNFAFWIFKTQLRIHMDMRVKLLSFCRQKYVIALSREKKSTLLLGQIQRIPALLCLRTRWRKTFFLKCILRFAKMAIARYARNLEKWAFFAWQVS